MDETKNFKMTKTYSISFADVNAVKEMAEFLEKKELKPVTDAEVLHRAIYKLYTELMFPVKGE